jgi:hypothetical protein
MPPAKVLPPHAEDHAEDIETTQVLTIEHDEEQQQQPQGYAIEELEEADSPGESFARHARQPPPTPARVEVNHAKLAQQAHLEPPPRSSGGSSGAGGSPKGTKASAATPAAHVHRAVVSVPGHPGAVAVTLDVSGQHTLSWSLDLTQAGRVVLPAGTANLYMYPAMTAAADGARSMPSSGGLRLLDEIILAIATSGCGLDEIPDEVGAFMQHALTVSNTPQGLALAERLFQAKPSLLAQVRAFL